MPGRNTPDDRTSEATLVERLRSGEEAAFEELVRSYGGRLLSVARRFLGDGEDARDAVQDAFLSAFRSLENFEGNALVSTWLHRIVVNAALMKLRSRRRKPETPIEDLLPKFIEDGHHAEAPAEWKLGAEDAASRGELRRLVRAHIDELPETHRSVLLMRDVEELDTGETAEILGIAPNAVKTRLHRARQALRTLLDPELRGVLA